MKQSTVYFTDFRTTLEENLLQKLARLLVRAGMDQIDFAGKFVAIKMHFGEPGNLAYLRPNFAKVVADLVRDCGGRPFLTDCNTLYVGGRKHALDHLDTANLNGFSPTTTGCQVIIADGLKGTDEVDVPVPGGELVTHAHIGRALMDADIVISLNHFKGHELTAYGGSIKNLGMGGGSRAGKMSMHAAGKPIIDKETCLDCGNCVRICAHGAPVEDGDVRRIEHDKCVGCGRCIGVCPVDAIYVKNDASLPDLCGKMAEYTKAVVDGRPHFHITIANAISPNCDCHSENDTPIVADIGMFASFDPVAIDQACIDAVNAAPRLQNTWIEDHGDPSIADTLTASHPTTNWRYQINHAKKIGLGTDDYSLVRI